MFGEDLMSLVSSAFPEDNEDESQDGHLEENEVKFDPNTLNVKTELSEPDAYESQSEEDFFRSINSDGESNGVESTKSGSGNGGQKTTRRLSIRIRRKNPSDDDDDDGDAGTSWHPYSTKKKSVTAKSKRGKRRGKGVNSPSGWRRKKVSEMSAEERERMKVKWREEQRLRRQKRREKLAAEGSQSENSEDDEEESTGVSKNKRRRSSSGGGRRKKVSEMTEEERERMKVKWREEARLKRERQQQRMTPEEREEFLRRQRHQRRMQRALQKGVSPIKEENQGCNEKQPKFSSPGTSRRKKVSEMTEEERERMKVKWREETRLRRQREREKMTPEERDEQLKLQIERMKEASERRKQRLTTPTALPNEEKGHVAHVSEIPEEKVAQESCSQNPQDKGEPTGSSGGKPTRGNELNPRQSSSTRKRYPKKRVSEMTEEQRQKKNEQTRLWRQRLLENMTPEEKEEYARRKREQRRGNRRRKVMTPEEREEHNKILRERRKERLAQLTEEEKRELAQSKSLRKLERLAAMTDEEMEARRQKMRQYRRQYYPPNDSEKRERFLSQVRGYYFKRKERLQAAGKWGEELEKVYKRRREKRLLAEERGEAIPKWNRRTNETPEEHQKRVEKIKQQNKERYRKFIVRKKLAVQQMIDQGMKIDEINRQLDSSEQRKRRLRSYYLRIEKDKLRKQLISLGASPEEIQVKLNEFAATYQPPREYRPYKPRPKQWNLSVDPEDLKLLEKPTRRCSRIPLAQAYIESRLEANLPDTIISPTEETSSCSYVSVSTTPEPPQTQVYPSHNQNQFPLQVHYQTTPMMYPHQPTFPNYNNTNYAAHSQPQNQTYSLQHIIDNMNYSPNQKVPVSMENTTGAFQQPHCSAYDTNTNCNDASSPPPSPDFDPVDDYDTGSSTYGGDIAQNYSTPAQATCALSYTQPTSSSIGFGRGRGRPRKTDSSPTKSRKKDQHQTVDQDQPSRGLQMGGVRDSVCDECGNFYSSVYLPEHKRNFHNPYFKDRQCTICGERFQQPRSFYKHYQNVHCNKNDTLPNEDKVRHYQCETCGKAFKTDGNLKHHLYHIHGAGSLSENFHPCHLCPGEKMFKTKANLLNHFKKFHPTYNPGIYKCSRCTESFRTETQLNEHVRDKHPEAYWPCKFCSSVKYSELGINFHYSNACLKIPKEEKFKIRKEMGDKSIEMLQTQCEFCNRNVCLMNLKRHYWEMHNVREEKFSCIRCDKTFETREYVCAHMVDLHNMQPEEWMETIRKLNVKDRSKVEVKNLEGKLGAAPINPFRKPEVEEKIQNNGGKLPRMGGRKKKEVEPKPAEGECDGEEAPKGKRKRGRPPGTKTNSKIIPKREPVSDESESSEADDDDDH